MGVRHPAPGCMRGRHRARPLVSPSYLDVNSAIVVPNRFFHKNVLQFQVPVHYVCKTRGGDPSLILGDKDPRDGRVSRKGCDQDSCYCSGANGGSSYGAASQLPAAFKLGQSHT